MRPMPKEVKEIIEELEKAVEPNDFGQGVVFAIQTIKAKYGIDDWEQDDEKSMDRYAVYCKRL